MDSVDIAKSSVTGGPIPFQACGHSEVVISLPGDTLLFRRKGFLIFSLSTLPPAGQFWKFFPREPSLRSSLLHCLLKILPSACIPCCLITGYCWDRLLYLCAPEEIVMQQPTALLPLAPLRCCVQMAEVCVVHLKSLLPSKCQIPVKE